MVRHKAAKAMLLASALLMTASPATGVNRYGLIAIANSTDAQITFNYRWGGRPWKPTAIAPNQVALYAYQYQQPDQNQSPALFVRFNSAVRENFNVRRYLTAKASPVNNDPAYSSVYVFRYDTNRSFIDIYSVPQVESAADVGFLGLNLLAAPVTVIENTTTQR